MTTPVQQSQDEYDNPFITPQSDADEPDNPFVAQATDTSSSAVSDQIAVPQPPPQQPTPQKSWQTKALEVGTGAGQGVLDLVKGVSDFAADVAAPLNPDYKPGPFLKEAKEGVVRGAEALAAPAIMAYEGGKEVLQGPTLKEQAHGAVTAGLGLLGLHEYATKAKGLIPKTVDPVSGKPPASPPSQPTPTEVLDKQAEVDKLAQQEKALAEQKAKSKNSLLRAANAWNTLSADQRRSVINGLADEQYNRRWVDLSSEAKVAVKKALIPPESDTNSYTSQEGGQQQLNRLEILNDPKIAEEDKRKIIADYDEAVIMNQRINSGEVSPMEADMYKSQNPYITPEMMQKYPHLGTGNVPSAQGVGPEATTPTPEPPLAQEGQGSTTKDLAQRIIDVHSAAAHGGDISYMDLPTLRAERERAEAKLQQMDIQNDSPTLQEHGKHERDFWQKYKNDLESAMVKKMGPGSTTPESVAKLGNEEGPDIAPESANPSGLNPGDPIRTQGGGVGTFIRMEGDYVVYKHGRTGQELKALASIVYKTTAEDITQDAAHGTTRRHPDDVANEGVANALAHEGQRPVVPPVEGKVVGKIEPGASAKKYFDEADKISKEIAKREKAGEEGSDMRQLYLDKTRAYFQGNIRKSPEARAEAVTYIREQLARAASPEHKAFLQSLLDEDQKLNGELAPQEPSKYQVGSKKDQIDAMLGKLREWDVEAQLQRMEAIKRSEQAIERLRESQKKDPGNASAYEHQIKQYQDMILSDGVVPEGIDINAKLKELADKEWAHTKGRTDFLKSVPRDKQENFEDIVAKLRRGEKPLTAAFDHEQAIDALLKAGAKYPGPEEGGSGALQSGGPAGPTTKGPEATKGSEGPTPGGSEATTIQLPNGRTVDLKKLTDEQLSELHQGIMGSALAARDPKIINQLENILDAIGVERDTRPPIRDGFISGDDLEASRKWDSMTPVERGQHLIKRGFGEPYITEIQDMSAFELRKTQTGTELLRDLFGPKSEATTKGTDESAADRLIQETTGRTEDKPMGAMSIEELKQAIKDWETGVKKGRWGNPQEVIDALKDTLAERLADSASEYGQYADDVKQLHEDLTSRKIDRAEWRKRADALAERKKALDKKYGNDPASRLAEDPLNYGKTDSNANPEDYPQEDTPSLDDAHQIDKLVNEPPPNTLELKYRESLNKMDLDQLDEQIDKARKLYDEQKISDADYRTLINDIADAKKSLKAKEMPKSVIPPKFNMPDTYNKDLSKFNDSQLSAAKRSLASMIQSEEAQRNPKLLKVLKDELNRMLDYDSEQRRKKEGGFLRLSFKRRTISRADQSALPHWEQNLAKRIGLEEDPVNPYSVMDRIRMAYARIFRQSEGIYQAEKRSGKKLAAHESPSVMAQLSNGFLVQVEEFERGNGPFVPDDQGGYTATGALPLNKIAAMVGNDVERLGWLAMARRELWERAEKNRTIGLDPVASQLMYVNTPDIYHRAADALADYMHSLVDYDIWGGLVDPAERNKFTSRFYAPIERIFGAEIQGAGASNITPRGQGKPGIGGDNPVKRFKGSTRRMRNPYETAMNMTARNIRAANQNHAVVILRNLAAENQKAYLGWMEPASAPMRNKIQAELRAKAEIAKNELGEEGQDLTVKDIEQLIGTMGDDALAIRDNVVNVWVGGKLEHWVVHPELAYALKSMGPHELGIVTRMAGLPARLQRWGIVNHPAFIMTMSMIDTFQAAINSKHGFVPVLSSFRAWWAAMTNSEEFVNYRRGGGGNASLTSRQYAKSTTSLSDVVGAPESQRPLDQALHQIKTMHPLKAWRTVVAPLAEAARVGEYLHARGRGASVVEAVYAAKNVVGDYSQMGGAMHALNHMALFLNPSLQVLDTTARVIKANPARWFLRSSVLGAAAYALYMANDGDQEIADLRQTPSGQRYLFVRTPSGEIIKIRKPYLEGSIFMSGIEAAMDKMKGENPEAFKLWRTAVIQELKINLLPSIGVIPAQIWANKDWQNDAPITPEADQEMSPMFQSGPNTGSAARIIGKEVNQSPAMIEWLARSQFGYLGSEGIAALEAAFNWRMSGEMPIPEELPFLNKVLVKYPSSNVRPIRDFYDRAKDVERVAADMEYMAEHEPEMLPHYMESHQKEMVLLDQWKDTRKELSDYRKSIEDVNSAPPDVIAPSVKHIYTDEFLRVMIETARAANLMHDAVKEATQ